MEPGSEDKPATSGTVTSTALNSHPPTHGPNDADFFFRIQRQMLQLSLEHASLSNSHQSAIQSGGDGSIFSRHSCFREDLTLVPYLHTSHRCEERLRRSLLRSDIKTVFDPIDLPVYQDNKKMHVQKESAVKSVIKRNGFESTKTKLNASKISKENCQSQVVNLDPTKQCTSSNKPERARPPSYSQKAKLSTRNKIARKRFTDSSLQCSLMGDGSCEAFNCNSAKISRYREPITSNATPYNSTDPKAVTETHAHPSAITTYRVIKVSSNTTAPAESLKNNLRNRAGVSLERTSILEEFAAPKTSKATALSSSANHHLIETGQYAGRPHGTFLTSESSAKNCQNAIRCQTTPKIRRRQRCRLARDDFLAFVSRPPSSSSPASSRISSPNDSTNTSSLNIDHAFQHDETQDRVNNSNSKSKQSLDTSQPEHPDLVSKLGCEQVNDIMAIKDDTTEHLLSNDCNKISGTNVLLNQQHVDIEATHLTFSPEHAKEDKSKDQALTGDSHSYANNNASEYDKRLNELIVQLREIRALLEIDTVRMHQRATKTSPRDIPKEIDIAFGSTMCSGEAVRSPRTQGSTSTLDRAVPSSVGWSNRCERVNPGRILGQCNRSDLSFSPNSSFYCDDDSFFSQPIRRDVRKRVQLLHPRRPFVEEESDTKQTSFSTCA
ncbi:hypothetical protein HJC23_007191 [Cyclotella cryptica]|uniref:Uncharacterized protein n=1 Tax=Cyclotella cryptica TaxID=29204 RepID=A0ABD3QQZ4_9STRA|eukprot:CCRYP_003471-RC/>CCRYP_003471-RC protein AED:0.21 eAED:0.21 QI:1739/1/1/1/0.8/0.66/6/134/664